MQSLKISHILSFILTITINNVFAQSISPHEILTEQSENCVSCHIKKPPVIEQLNTKNHPVDLASLRADGIKLCTQCHTEDGHIVGIQLDFPVPTDLPLDADKTISCLTCHYTHGSLATDRPQASYSFMDRLLDSDRLHKSFLIRRNNVNGELCLVCHNVNQGK